MQSETVKAPFTTPILFLIFNRPETTRRVMDAIRSIKPRTLYIVADGPRENKPEDQEKCRLAREIANTVDWNCDVRKLFRAENFGCGKGPASAISWFFEQESEGIILEDDCLPSTSFFYFCAELLERYREDTRVMEIGGTNFENEHLRGKEYSYFFSNMIYIWGWATWRRAWKLYDYEMGHYHEITNKGYLDNHYDFNYEREHFKYIFEKMHTGDERTSRKTVWDYQWQFICKINSGLIIVPERNLVSNLGFGKEATNTKDPLGAGHNLIREEMEFPLRHPEFMMVQKRRDQWYFKEICSSKIYRMKATLKSFIPGPIYEIVKPAFHKLKELAMGLKVNLSHESGVFENQR